jgi:hypothetical protein
MKHGMGVVDCAADCVAVAHVRDDDLQALAVHGPQPGEVLLDAGPRQVVEDPHLVATGEQPVRHVRADEAGAAGDQDPVAGGWIRTAVERAHTVSPLPTVPHWPA